MKHFNINTLASSFPVMVSYKGPRVGMFFFSINTARRGSDSGERLTPQGPGGQAKTQGPGEQGAKGETGEGGERKNAQHFLL